MKTNHHETLVLSSKDVQQIVLEYGLDKLMDHLIHSLEQAILAYDVTAVDIPIRSGFNYKTPNVGLVEWMPMHLKQDEIVIKIVGYHPNNPTHYNLPTILSTISSYDTGSGHLKGLVDGVLLTARRTGAASAVASKYLAQPNSSTLGLIGCGAQSITQLHAISRIFDLTTVLIYDTDAKAISDFQNRSAFLELNVEIIPVTITEMLTQADILCTATSIEVGEGPLFNNLEVNPSIHINAVGSDFPGKVELPIDLLRKSLVCPDFKEQAKIEGECQQLTDEMIGPDLTTLLQQNQEYQAAKDQITVFDSTGWALEDQVVMGLFVKLADEMGIGRHLELENILEDSKNPYHFLSTQVPSTLEQQ